MPNWCRNRTTITGLECVVQAFLDQAKTKNTRGESCNFTLNAFIPIPDDIPRSEPMIDWCIANWGTKWDCKELSIKRRNGKAVIDFCTAWGPPMPVVQAMAKAFPSLEFTHEFVELGVIFAGRHQFASGRCIEFRDWDERNENEVLKMAEILKHKYF